jgi:hypothetical protein
MRLLGTLDADPADLVSVVALGLISVGGLVEVDREREGGGAAIGGRGAAS